MVDECVVRKLHTNIIKATKDIKKLRAKNYLSPIKNKIWKKVAEEYIMTFSDTIYEILNKYKKDVIKLIGKESCIYNTSIHIEKSNKKTKDYKTHEYLDKWYNRVVVDDIRDELVELKNKYNKELEDAFNQHIKQGYNKDATNLVYKEIGMEFNFNKFDSQTSKYLNEKKINWAKQVSQTNEYLVKRALNKGYEEGLDTYDIAKLIEDSTGFDFRRAEAIARTEILISSNYVDYVSYMQNESIIKLWWSSASDDRTRKSHQEINGKEVLKGEPFLVGGHKMRFPGDSSLGAPAKEIINCRCIIRPIFTTKKLNNFNIDSGINSIHNEITNINEFRFIEKISKQNGLTEGYRHAITSRFSNGTELAQALFLKYVQDNSVTNTGYIGGAHYNSNTKDIYMNFEEDLNNARGSGTTYFHEHGHLIDGVCGFLSVKTNFTDILKKDYENFLKYFIKENNIKTKIEAYKKISRKISSVHIKHNLSSVSDLLEGLSNSRIIGPYGHGKGYWNKKPYMIGLEAFAHFYEAQFDIERLKILETYFPMSSKVFKQFMQALANKK